DEPSRNQAAGPAPRRTPRRRAHAARLVRGMWSTGRSPQVELGPDVDPMERRGARTLQGAQGRAAAQRTPQPQLLPRLRGAQGVGARGRRARPAPHPGRRPPEDQPGGTPVTDLAKYGPWAVIAGGSEGVGAEFADQLA